MKTWLQNSINHIQYKLSYESIKWKFNNTDPEALFRPREPINTIWFNTNYKLDTNRCDIIKRQTHLPNSSDAAL